MWLRKAFYYGQFWAIPVLPLWVLMSRGIAIDGSGWALVFLLFAVPTLSVALIILMALTVARKSVRRTRLLSWADVGVLTVWYAIIALAGVSTNSLVAVGVIVMTLAAFWIAVWQLVVETRNRFSPAFAGYDPMPS